MTMKDIKQAYLPERTYCQTAHEFYGNDNWKLVNVGRKYVKIMSHGGRLLRVEPSEIARVWI